MSHLTRSCCAISDLCLHRALVFLSPDTCLGCPGLTFEPRHSRTQAPRWGQGRDSGLHSSLPLTMAYHSRDLPFRGRVALSCRPCVVWKPPLPTFLLFELYCEAISVLVNRQNLRNSDLCNLSHASQQFFMNFILL